MSRKQEAIGQMFDQIAPTYDSVNRILSFRQDIRWRAKTAAELAGLTDVSVLDVATGTADLLIAMCTQNDAVTSAVGVDISENMLAIGEKKIKVLGLDERASLQKADARKLPFCDKRFDVVTIGFGIRNVVDIPEALDEMHRVLKPGGRLLILEFSLPKTWLLRKMYLFYFRYVLPYVGGIFAKNVSAYRYLNRTVEAFFSVSSFSKLLSTRGFASVSAKPLSCGIATLYCARKS